MNPRNALRVIAVLSLGGILFSAYLSVQELFGAAALSCPAPGAPGTVLGYPACVYGLVMYLAVFIVALLGLRRSSAH